MCLGEPGAPSHNRAGGGGRSEVRPPEGGLSGGVGVMC
jgi:hypothetical protein